LILRYVLDNNCDNLAEFWLTVFKAVACTYRAQIEPPYGHTLATRDYH